MKKKDKKQVLISWLVLLFWVQRFNNFQHRHLFTKIN